MKQIVKSGVALTEPIKTRFEWINEVDDQGKCIFWLYLQTETFDGELHHFSTAEKRTLNTQSLYELHHFETCLHLAPAPGNYPIICFDHFGIVDGFKEFQELQIVTGEANIDVESRTVLVSDDQVE